MQVKELIYKMLTTSTGKHMLDSGGENGRHWQKNQIKTIEDFEREPSAVIDVSKYEREGVIEWDCYPYLSLYHHLKNALTLDPLCDEFNALPVEDWRGEYFGVSDSGMEWLQNNGFKSEGDSWNSYNWSSNFSQDVQGVRLKRAGEYTDEYYTLLQIHQGADIRGGYTDAKLFKLESEDGFLYESAGFCANLPNDEYITLDWQGAGWIDNEGGLPSPEYMARFCSALGEGLHAGEMFEIN